MMTKYSVFALGLVTALTSQASLDKTHIYYPDLEAVAKHAIAEEVSELNTAIQSKGYQKFRRGEAALVKGYKNKDLKIFQKFGKVDGIDADILFERCILTVETIEAITDTQFTKSNLAVTSNLLAVLSTKDVINSKFFGVIESACLNSRTRFEERLKSAKVLDQVKEVTQIVFFPTDFAKPSLKKKLLSTLPFVINAGFIVGAGGAILGSPVPGVWMSLTGLTASALAIHNMRSAPDEIIRQRKTELVDESNGLRIDLTEGEKKLHRDYRLSSIESPTSR